MKRRREPKRKTDKGEWNKLQKSKNYKEDHHMKSDHQSSNTLNIGYYTNKIHFTNTKLEFYLSVKQRWVIIHICDLNSERTYTF